MTLAAAADSDDAPRVRSKAGEEVELPSFAFASHRDPLDAQTVNAVACGISTRKYARSFELPEEVTERATSKSAVSRRYVALTTTQLPRWLATPLGDRHFPIVLTDGIVLGDHTVVIALGVDTGGRGRFWASRRATPNIAAWPQRFCVTSSVAAWIRTGAANL